MDKGLKLFDRVIQGPGRQVPGQLSGGHSAWRRPRWPWTRSACCLTSRPGARPEMVNEVLDVMTELAHEGMTMMRNARNGFAKRVADRHLHGQGPSSRTTARRFLCQPAFAAAQQFPARSFTIEWPDGR